ncbi:hypothetical protein OOK41_31640 [Micromonospora sp. NBC_01655]|uniref:hypothetical protein n=1 Tax=Micromonospora sp. NBC_01655 TaxID=2975983 RepID=UPI00225728FD|nr:hypothetical protein [Micromonospora sp. NBC_01655]MCX4474815.1 hypothetical protein [Micromonospora sp. NBC_01655]
MYDVGDTVTLSATCHDAAGQPANAATATLTVTRPDGTVDPQTPTNPPASAGLYQHPYVPSQYGRHVVRWTFTGGVPDQAYPDVVNVADASWPAIVGLGETKNHLNIDPTNTTHDDELRGFILSASEVVESIVGPVARRTVVETHGGGGHQVVLRQRPVLSVTSVVENGATMPPSEYTVTPAGVLSLGSSYWCNPTVTYVVGRLAVPAAVLDGTKELIRINWRPQTGGNGSVFDQGRGDTFGPTGQGEVRLGFFVPNTVMQRLETAARPPLVA